MKEVTYEDWQKNPTPRMMWVWDDDEDDKKKLKVLYIVQCEILSVITTTHDNRHIYIYKHCAEIEKQRRMTNKEFSRWLREKPTREYKYRNSNDNYIYGYHDYKEQYADEEVTTTILIREDDGEWREPLVEVEE